MTFGLRYNLSTIATVKAMVVVAVAIVLGCSDESQPIVKCPRTIRKEQVLKLVAARSQQSSIVHTKRSVFEFRHDYNFTSIRRRGFITEEGEYDSVWVPSKGSYFAFVHYRYHYPDASLDFLAAWPMLESDKVPVGYIMVERNQRYTGHASTTVNTNLVLVDDINQIVGSPFDTLKQKQLDIEVSYDLLVTQPMEFFKQLKLGGHPLLYYSPESFITF